MLNYSVIIPVYHVEKDLPACIDSVLAQDTTSEYEVILVDDGSPDRCGEICDAYAAKYKHIRVIHQKNAGVSAARNAGIEAAQGEYLLFLDGDDLWKPQLLSTLDGFLSRQPDMVLFCYETFDENGSVSAVYPPLFPNGESGRTYLERGFATGELPFWSAALYAFRRAFVRENDLQFIVGLQVAEDMEFTLSCLSVARSLNASRQVLYRYRTRYSSASYQISARRLRQRMETDAKWADMYPFPAMANCFALEGLSIAQIPEQDDRRALRSFYFRHRQILSQTTGSGRIAYGLLRILGIRLGSKVFFMLVRSKHLLLRKKRTKSV